MRVVSPWQRPSWTQDLSTDKVFLDTLLPSGQLKVIDLLDTSKQQKTVKIMDLIEINNSQQPNNNIDTVSDPQQINLLSHC